MRENVLQHFKRELLTRIFYKEALNKNNKKTTYIYIYIYMHIISDTGVCSGAKENYRGIVGGKGRPGGTIEN